MRDDDLIKSRVSAREEKTNLVPKTMILVNDVMKDNSSLTENHTIDSSPVYLPPGFLPFLLEPVPFNG